MLVGLACLALGDEDTATLDLEAARRCSSSWGQRPTSPASTRCPEGRRRVPMASPPRELEVLRLVAAGATNRAIAASLVLSERTVDRHVSNIFTKLRVPSRAAATAYAYEHRLI